MEKKEFEEFVAKQKEAGMSEEDIAKGFALMFKKGDISRKELEAFLDALGYEMDEELSKLSDEELKEEILDKADDEEEEGADADSAKHDEQGPIAPKADKGEPEKGESEEFEEKKSDKDDSDEVEWEESKKYFNID